MKTYASMPIGLLLFTTGMVAGLCLRPRVNTRASHLLQAVAPEGADYLREAGAIDLFQIEAGKVARTRAGDAEVQAYAEKMVKHHERSLLQMRRAARLGGFDIDRFPALTGPYHELLAALRSAPDHLFDSIYLRVQAQVHEAAVDLHDDVVALSQAAYNAAEMTADHLTEAETLTGRRRPGSTPFKPEAGFTPQPRPPGQPQTPNQTPGDGSSSPFMSRRIGVSGHGLRRQAGALDAAWAQRSLLSGSAPLTPARVRGTGQVRGIFCPPGM